MTTIATTFAGGIYGPATPIPKDAIEVVATTTSYTVASPADFFSPTPPVTPLGAITNKFAGTLAVPATFFGMNFTSWPNTTVGVNLPSCDVVRIHDYSGGTASRRAHWKGIETSPGVYDWSLLDPVVATHYAAGRKIIYTLLVTPNFYSARPAESGAYGPGTAAEPSDLTKWDNFCAALATRYAGRITHYEVWNEPQDVNFYSGTQTILSQLVRRANQTIKAIDANAKIISPPITSIYSGGTGVTYFTGMMAASDGVAGTMAQWVDVIGCHIYPQSSSALNGIANMAATMRTAMTTAGVSAKPLWSTEVTILTPAFPLNSAGARATAIRQIMVEAAASNVGGFDVCVWYSPDGATYRWTQEDVQVYENFKQQLMNGVTVVNAIKDGRVATVVNNQQYLWSPL